MPSQFLLTRLLRQPKQLFLEALQLLLLGARHLFQYIGGAHGHNWIITPHFLHQLRQQGRTMRQQTCKLVGPPDRATISSSEIVMDTNRFHHEIHIIITLPPSFLCPPRLCYSCCKDSGGNCVPFLEG